MKKGQSLVELALTITILLILLSGAVEFGMAFFQFVQLRDAAQEGAQFGSYCQDLGKITTRARGASNSPINLDTEAQILVENDGVEGGGIKVSMFYEHKVFMPFLSPVIGEKITLNASVTDTILKVNPTCP
jgi:Flp pilus assembly protein TadG